MLTGQKRNKRIMRVVIWNGMEFESQSALGRHLKIYQGGGSQVSKAIKNKSLLRGHKVIYKTYKEL